MGVQGQCVNGYLDWQPSASISILKERAKLLSDIRTFFEKRGVLEVETPLLCSTASLDPHINPISVLYKKLEFSTTLPKEENYYLQTSPEFAMKRLLAAGSGPIYQLCKAFRNDEVGRFHNPEFTILEWYQPGFTHHDLMQEVDELLQVVLGTLPAEKISYEAIFQKVLHFNPHTVSLDHLKQVAILKNVILSEDITKTLTVDDWLDILMTHCIEPQLGLERPMMLYDYPITKAALAKIRTGNPSVAERFEVYVQGIELANGFHELLNSEEQKDRFLKNLETRKALGYPVIPIDQYLIAALESGMPSSSGVALGVDRLLMLKFQSSHINEVVSFTIDRV